MDPEKQCSCIVFKNAKPEKGSWRQAAWLFFLVFNCQLSFLWAQTIPSAKAKLETAEGLTTDNLEEDALVDAGDDVPLWNGRAAELDFIEELPNGEYLYETSEEDSHTTYLDTDAEPRPPSEEAKRQGLESVLKDGSYLYKATRSDRSGAFSLGFGTITPPLIENELGFIYSDFYGEGDLPSVFFDYEWILTQTAGLLSFGVGTGLSMSKGNGRFITGEEALEEYQLFILPNQIYLTYRLQFWDQQWLVPFVRASYFPIGLAELREDESLPNLAIAHAIGGGGGIKINLNYFDSVSLYELDADYGINNLWLDIEYRNLTGLDEIVDFSSEMVHAGFAFDF